MLFEISLKLLVLSKKDLMHLTTHKESVSNALNTIDCKGFPGLQVFVGLDILNEMQVSEFDINFTFN